MLSVERQKTGEVRLGEEMGEARDEPKSGETRDPRNGTESTGAGLLYAVLSRENMLRAWERVKGNKGAAGVDGLNIEQTSLKLQTEWPIIRDQLLQGKYRPSPVRRVTIPKPEGGERKLSIPTVTDRLIQQAVLQVLQPIIDPTFSEHSYGFRPGRGAHDAVKAAQAYIQTGRRIVVDVDLEKFFDRVNHDILMSRLRKHVTEDGIIRLVRAYLDSGIMSAGVGIEREGVQQGGPLSPLLANVMLDEVDKELERRGHCFVRYADDCNVYVKSQKSGERVMESLKRSYDKLRLKVNETKSVVANVETGRKFLGYSFWVTKDGEVKLKVADKPLSKFKQRVRELTRRSSGRSMANVIKRLRIYLLGWKAYFGKAQRPWVWQELDGWLRHRLRALHLKHWKQGKTVYRELRVLGASDIMAKQIAAHTSSWWHNSTGFINRVLNIAYFDRLGLPRLS